jgi:hypothetical protein
MPTDEGAKTKEGLNGSDYHRSRSAEVEGAPRSRSDRGIQRQDLLWSPPTLCS